nr:MAG TPA_asm: Innexin [Caudoviricetes sp.]
MSADTFFTSPFSCWISQQFWERFLNFPPDL